MVRIWGNHKLPVGLHPSKIHHRTPRDSWPNSEEAIGLPWFAHNIKAEYLAEKCATHPTAYKLRIIIILAFPLVKH